MRLRPCLHAREHIDSSLASFSAASARDACTPRAAIRGATRIILHARARFVSLVRRVERTPLSARLFDKYAARGYGQVDRAGLQLDIDTFRRMWKAEQGEAPPPPILGMFESLGFGGISENGFHQLLMSKANDVLNPAMVSEVHQDMSKPLTHYLIHASHRSVARMEPRSL